jgi:hypothetical protein
MLKGCNMIRLSLILFLLIGLIVQIADADPLNANLHVPSSNYLSRFSPDRAHIFFQLGGFDASQGKAQNIGIKGLIGDRFSVSRHNDQDVLLGLGYFIDGMNKEKFNLLFGINAFYLAQTAVKGKVIQEQLFSNLSYRYLITNYPIYVAAKALIHTNNDRYDIILDLGIGPNVMDIHQFREYSINALPDRVFSSHSSVAFSTEAGLGIKFNNLVNRLSLEIGYRFFYLGRGYLKKNNDQLTSTLNTGNSYANALVISMGT